MILFASGVNREFTRFLIPFSPLRSNDVRESVADAPPHIRSPRGEVMRMSRWIMVALFILSAVVVVEAQQPRQGGGGFGQINTNTLVLSNKDLQAELKVTDAQKEKFKTIGEKNLEAQKKRGEAYKDKFADAGGDKDKLKDVFASMQKENQKDQEETKKSVEELLTSDQKKRIA